MLILLFLLLLTFIILVIVVLERGKDVISLNVLRPSYWFPNKNKFYKVYEKTENESECKKRTVFIRKNFNINWFSLLFVLCILALIVTGGVYLVMKTKVFSNFNFTLPDFVKRRDVETPIVQESVTEAIGEYFS